MQVEDIDAESGVDRCRAADLPRRILQRHVLDGATQRKDTEAVHAGGGPLQIVLDRRGIAEAEVVKPATQVELQQPKPAAANPSTVPSGYRCRHLRSRCSGWWPSPAGLMKIEPASPDSATPAPPSPATRTDTGRVRMVARERTGHECPAPLAIRARSPVTSQPRRRQFPQWTLTGGICSVSSPQVTRGIHGMSGAGARLGQWRQDKTPQWFLTINIMPDSFWP